MQLWKAGLPLGVSALSMFLACWLLSASPLSSCLFFLPRLPGLTGPLSRPDITTLCLAFSTTSRHSSPPPHCATSYRRFLPLELPTWLELPVPEALPAGHTLAGCRAATIDVAGTNYASLQITNYICLHITNYISLQITNYISLHSRY